MASNSSPWTPPVILGSTAREIYAAQHRQVRVDDDGRLEVVTAAGAPLDTNIQEFRGVTVVRNGVDLAGEAWLVVAGTQADNGRAYEAWPNVIGGVASAAEPGAALVDGRPGYLSVTSARRLRVDTDLARVGGNATVTAGVNGLLAVGGPVADGAAADASGPLKTGGVADAVLSLVADGAAVQFVTDLYRRLWVVIAGYDSSSNANRTFEVAPLNLQVLEESLLDTTNHAVSAGISYPSDDGLVMMGYRDFSLTGKLICGANNTVTLTVEATNDEDATPANRDWSPIYGYDLIGNAAVNSVACGAGATVLFNIDFESLNCRYVRVRLVITNAGALSNTIIIKIRRKAL